jgi:hypothetical protein
VERVSVGRSEFYLDEIRWLRGRNALGFVALVSLTLCALGLATDRVQFARSWLIAFCFAMTIVLGGAFFVFVQYLTGSAWSVTVRRFMENVVVTVPVGLLLFVPIALNLHSLYEWTHAGVIANDHLVRAKLSYLNPAAFTLRTIAYFALWTIWAFGVWRQSTKQDRQGSIEQMHAASRWSAPGLLLIVVTGTLASFDWIMSLDPHWYSTIFGVYCLSGGGLAFFGVITLIALGLRSAGVMKSAITLEHYHDLGKWMFALTVFWTYIAFSQYLLIWYANIPEETIFFRERMAGSWKGLSAVLLFGRFILPFVVLIFRASKRNLRVLGAAAAWIVAMHFVDMYWLIAPNFNKTGIAFHWMDVAAVAGVASVLALAFWSRLRRHALAPVGDLRFQQGLHFENLGA